MQEASKLVLCVMYDDDELPDLMLIPAEDFTNEDRDVFRTLTDPFVSYMDWMDALESYWDLYHDKYSKYVPEYPAFTLPAERIAEVHVAYTSSVIFDYRFSERSRRQPINHEDTNGIP